MEHLYPGVLEPVTEVIENLIALPARIGNYSRRQSRRLEEKEEALHQLEKTLTERSTMLAEQEFALKERWDAGRIHKIAAALILPNPYQPRRVFDDLSLYSLSESIKKHGILQPLIVRCLSDAEGTPSPTYELICGERRLRAALAISLQEVPCIILDINDRRSAELALIENLQRENLNIFEQASAIAALIDMHTMTQEQIAKSLSVSQSCIANKLRILRLTEQERDIILSKHLTERHARAFLRMKDLEQRIQTVHYVANHNLNVAQTEAYIDKLLTIEEPAEEETTAPNNTKSTKKLIIKDIRLFFNTVDRAVTSIRDAGIPVESIRDEKNGEIRLTIVLPQNVTHPAEEARPAPVTKA